MPHGSCDSCKKTMREDDVDDSCGTLPHRLHESGKSNPLPFMRKTMRKGPPAAARGRAGARRGAAG